MDNKELLYVSNGSSTTLQFGGTGLALHLMGIDKGIRKISSAKSDKMINSSCKKFSPSPYGNELVNRATFKGN